MVCASINKRTQTTLTSASVPLANVYYRHGSNNLLSSSAKSANNARPALLRDISQHPLGINVRAIYTFHYTLLALCALILPHLSCPAWKNLLNAQIASPLQKSPLVRRQGQNCLQDTVYIFSRTAAEVSEFEETF